VAALSVLDLARALVDIDSTTGREAEACAWLTSYLRGRGFEVREQDLGQGRVNVFAFVDPAPRVVLSTHIDCVPPFVPGRIDGGNLYGRGACDAKGALAAQITAAERLREKGEHGVGLLFVVGEERGSDGAAAADALAPGSAYLVNGEPTDGRLGIGTRGVLRLRLKAEGKAAHSSQPERGVSAIDKLLDALVALRSIDLAEDAELGRTHYSIGLISGGVAPNVISPAAEAEVLFRTVGPGSDILARLARLLSLVSVETVLEVPPVRLHTVPGFERAAFAFTTDIPLLARWGRPLLYGPGSILDAHSDGEHVAVADLETAVAAYQHLAERLLAEHPTPTP
jgi:acetylornithine deacetylase